MIDALDGVCATERDGSRGAVAPYHDWTDDLRNDRIWAEEVPPATLGGAPSPDGAPNPDEVGSDDRGQAGGVGGRHVEQDQGRAGGR